MRFAKPRSEFLGSLLESMELEHYVLHFSWRDVRSSANPMGGSISGVRNFGLLQAYAEGLERIYRVMTQLGFTVTVDESKKSHVYIASLCHGPEGSEFTRGTPFTSVDLDGIPYVGLPCRSEEPGIHDAMERSRLEGTHEAFHLFTRSGQMPLSVTVVDTRFREVQQQAKFWESAWIWMDDASATFFEHVCYPGNDDGLRFCMNWIDLPEVSMDHRTQAYEGAMFLRYVDRCRTRYEDFQGRFIMQVWQEARAAEGELPLQALSRLVTGEENPQSLALFADFCADSYFVGDPCSEGFAYDVAARFGTPTVSVHAVGSRTEPISDAVNHLACRYYRFVDIPDGVAVAIAVDSACPHVKVSAALCGPFQRRLRKLEFSIAGATQSVRLGPSEINGARSVIVTVTNTALDGTFDGAEFKLSVTLASTASS